MGRKKSISLVDQSILACAETDLKRLPNGHIAQRLMAIIAAGHQRPLHDIGDVLCVTRQAVATWIRRYKEGGVAGLEDKPKGHRRKRLTSAQEDRIREWLDRRIDPQGAPMQWTIDQLMQAIRDEFGVPLGRTRVWGLMRGWGYRPKQPRPRHAKADAEVQATFKKNSPN